MLRRRVAVVGSGQTQYKSNHVDKLEIDLIYEAVKKALRGTGLSIGDVGFVCDSGNDVLDGRSISNCTTIGAMGAHRKPEYQIGEDASFAAFFAYLKLLSGECDTALVVGYGKSSNIDRHQFSNMMFEPFFVRPLGLDEVSTAGLQARAYMSKYGITDAQTAKVAAKNRASAQLNPYALLRESISPQEVLDSRVICEPIKELEIYPSTDGACAVLLATEEIAYRLNRNPAWVLGVGQSVDTYNLGNRDLSVVASARVAAEKAYAMAGIRSPADEIDVAEISAGFAHQELMLYEALGFCQVGEGGRLIDESATAGGMVAVNPSGGLLAANPITASGLVRIAETALQVSGQAGERQVPNVMMGLAHGASGLCLQGNCVFVLGRE